MRKAKLFGLVLLWRSGWMVRVRVSGRGGATAVQRSKPDRDSGWKPRGNWRPGFVLPAGQQDGNLLADDPPTRRYQRGTGASTARIMSTVSHAS